MLPTQRSQVRTPTELIEEISLRSTTTSLQLEKSGLSMVASSLILPEILNIGERAFFGNKVLCSIILPEGLKTIDNYAFYNCSNLSSINIPISITSIGEMAFYGCSSLKSISILDGTHIGENAFYKSGIYVQQTINTQLRRY